MSSFMRLSLALLLMFTVLLGMSNAQAAPFTLQADEALQPAVAALHTAQYGTAPTFVTTDADLIATTDRTLLPEDSVSVPPHFLPDAFFVVRSESASAFVDFAISPDGQQTLIDAGFLPASVTIVDQVGNTLDIPQPVRRAITPYSLATYVIYGVGAADRLVAGGYLGARTPEGAARMEAIDPRFPELSSYVMNQREINIEEIANLAPDVIFASARSAWLDTVAELGIPTVLFQGESPELLKQSLTLAGQIFGPNAAARAAAWIAYYDRVLSAVVAQTSGLSDAERPRVLVIGTEPLRVISGDMYQTDIVAAAGGQSVSAELKGSWNDVNLEQVVLWDPDVIIIVPYGNVTVATLTDSPEWQVIKAVQDGKVYKMPSWVAPWDTPVPDSVLGIIWLAQKLFPERIALDCSAEAVTFFNAFYGYDIPRDDIAAVCAS